MCVKGDVQEGMRESEGEWDRMRGAESKKRKQEQVGKNMRESKEMHESRQQCLQEQQWGQVQARKQEHEGM